MPVPQVLGTLLRPQPDALAGLLAWAAIVAGAFHFAASQARSRRAAFVQASEACIAAAVRLLCALKNVYTMCSVMCF